MKRFGEGWAPREGVIMVATPVGEPCLHCKVVIVDGDLGVVLPFSGGTAEVPIESEVVSHRACFLQSIGLREDDPRG